MEEEEEATSSSSTHTAMPMVFPPFIGRLATAAGSGRRAELRPRACPKRWVPFSLARPPPMRGALSAADPSQGTRAAAAAGLRSASALGRTVAAAAVNLIHRPAAPLHNGAAAAVGVSTAAAVSTQGMLLTARTPPPTATWQTRTAQPVPTTPPTTTLLAVTATAPTVCCSPTTTALPHPQQLLQEQPAAERVRRPNFHRLFPCRPNSNSAGVEECCDFRSK